MTTRDTIIYMAHPVAPFDVRVTDDKAAHTSMALNLRNAQRWLRCLQEANPGVAMIAPWIGQCLGWPEADSDPKLREMAILRNLMLIERCDGVVMVGGRVTAGMRGEKEYAEDNGLLVFDLTHLGYWAPVKGSLVNTVKLAA